VAGLGFVGVSSLLGAGGLGGAKAYKRKGERDITRAESKATLEASNTLSGSTEAGEIGSPSNTFEDDEIGSFDDDGSIGSPGSHIGESEGESDIEDDDEDVREGEGRERKKGKKKRRYERGNYVTVGGYDREQLERWRSEIRECTDNNAQAENEFFQSSSPLSSSHEPSGNDENDETGSLTPTSRVNVVGGHSRKNLQGTRNRNRMNKVSGEVDNIPHTAYRLLPTAYPYD